MINSARICTAENFLREWGALRESNSHLNLGKLAGNFKNAGNGGLFNVFEVPQMENGRWKMHTASATAGISVNTTAFSVAISVAGVFSGVSLLLGNS